MEGNPHREEHNVPLKKTKDVGKVLSELKKSSKKRPRKQMIAIALDQVRKSGGKVSPKKA